MKNFKETTFIKQIERTAKRDAYLTAARYIQSFGVEYGLKVILEKADSHTQYLNGLPLAYNYATQSLESKETCVDGELLNDALNSLTATIKEPK